MIRVLFVLGSLGGGGAERQTLTWLRYLDRKAFTPSLYLITRNGQLSSDLPTDVEIAAYEDRSSSPKIYIPGQIYHRQTRDLAAIIYQNQVDLVVSVSLHMTLLAAGTLQRTMPWIAVEMADPRRDFADQVTRFRGIKLHRLQKAYRRATPVAVSLGVKQGLESFYNLKGDSIHVLPNFIDVQAVDREIAEKNVSLTENQFHIATVGRLQPQKGHRFLLQAMHELVHKRSLKQLHLHLLGEGPLRSELETLSRNLDLQDHVTFEGFVAQPAPFVSRCDLFCLPSLYEGLPLALLEAMACRVPVVATDCPSGPREILQNGAFGRLVPAEAADALADAIEQVVRDPVDSRQTATAARNHIETEYSVPVGIPRLQELLRRAASLR